MRYFAYGSNLSISRLQQRVPSAHRVGLFMLHSHDLRFHKSGKDGSGKCDAFETGDSSHFVMGSLFEIDPSEKPYLDRAEGLGFGYEEKEVTVVDESGLRIKARTYYATKIDESLRPYSWYLNHVTVGAIESSVSGLYLERIKSIVSTEDPCQERDARERAIHNQQDKANLDAPPRAV